MIKDGKCATENEVKEAILKHKPFGEREVIVLTSRPYYPEKIRAIGRVIVLDAISGKVLFADDSNYKAVEKFRDGWTFQPMMEGFGLAEEVQSDIRPLIEERAKEQARDALSVLEQLHPKKKVEVEKVLNRWAIGIL